MMYDNVLLEIATKIFLDNIFNDFYVDHIGEQNNFQDGRTL